MRAAADEKAAGVPGWLYAVWRRLLRRPKDTVALCLAVGAAATITVNALFFQTGPHPAPMFRMESKAAPAHKIVQAPRPASPVVQLPRPAPIVRDPIAEIIGAPNRVISVQRALSEFGYGQIRPDGFIGQETKAAIERFERDHDLPVTGQISDQLVQKLAALARRPI